ELQPDDWMVVRSRSSLYAHLNQWDKALADSSCLIELRPAYSGSWWHRSGLYMSHGQLDKALSDLSKSVDLDPDIPVFLRDRAICYAALRQWTGAIDDCSKWIELQPDNLDSWVKRGECFRSSGNEQNARTDFTTALDLYGKAIERKPDDASLRRGLANV